MDSLVSDHISPLNKAFSAKSKKTKIHLSFQDKKFGNITKSYIKKYSVSVIGYTHLIIIGIIPAGMLLDLKVNLFMSIFPSNRWKLFATNGARYSVITFVGFQVSG